MFAKPDFYLCTDADRFCPSGSSESLGTDVWNHGAISPDINQSWMAFVGPGTNLRVSDVWASETDTRPTLARRPFRSLTLRMTTAPVHQTWADLLSLVGHRGELGAT